MTQDTQHTNKTTPHVKNYIHAIVYTTIWIMSAVYFFLSVRYVFAPLWEKMREQARTVTGVVEDWYATWSDLCLRETCFGIEYAITAEQKEQGLMWREELWVLSWMLFVYDEPSNYRFWMKNTLIPLDMLWLDQNYTTVYIHQNAQPCTAQICPSYGPDTVAASYVLELNGWVVEQYGINIWDTFVLTSSN